ncbi:hypothetical protein ACDA55_38045 [Rhizobium ruizarguesonis]
MKLIALQTPKSRKDAALLDHMYRLRSRFFAAVPLRRDSRRN